ncbi:MAG: hypothetical protein IIB74_04520 [Proteobacteria bacterium]|nr:hypothetical protein [Pseudomonadota bacterium]
MGRILIAVLALAGLPWSAMAADNTSGYEIRYGVEFGFLKTSGYPSWTTGFVGKLRYDNDGAVFNRAFVDYRGRFGDTINVHMVLEGYDDDLGNTIDFTEAYVEWRPMPKSATRYRVKVGAFYPRISLENVDPGWSNRYTQNSSAINTWVAEELRTIGAELTVSRRPESLGGAHAFSASVAAFVANDPAGSLLAWKGWSVHDRQSRFSDKLPLPPLPQIQPGMMFDDQNPYVEPFKEIDGRVGYYVNGEWRFGKKFLLRAMHYDNRADPRAEENGQYAWTTKFEHLGMQTTLPGDIGLIAQWMIGSTVMGPVMNGAHVVDTEYDAQFVLLTRAFKGHRVSARYDHFEITQNDSTEDDNNPEKGHAWTLNYQYSFSDRIGIAAEWLSIKTHRCSWEYYDIPTTATERQVQLTLKLRF